MKTRIRKVYGYWFVEFPFGMVIYCQSWRDCIDVLGKFDEYLLASAMVAR